MLGMKKEDFKNDYKVINNLRCLSLDMIDNAKSGHPGICLGAAPILYTLFSRHLSFNRKEVDWYNRDRFVLSAGHGAPLLYAMLYMLDLLSLDDLKDLRKLGSNTPGHPEITTPGVDMATGPLGQGIASAVGMAIAERYLNATINNKLINHYTYVLCGDGDLMEGVSYEALSLASRLRLNKLIILYDYNNITLDGKLSDSNEEDVITRFKALNFNILIVNDGESILEIDKAISKAKQSTMPSIIIVKTVIGKHSVNEGTNVVHGKPLTKEDISSIKNKLDIYDTPFTVSMDAINYLCDFIDKRMYLVYKDWVRRFGNLKEKEQENIKRLMDKKNTYLLKDIDIDYEGKSLRDISGSILNTISEEFDLLIGGSADLSSSCKTNLVNGGVFNASNYKGRNIYFGVREHAMGSIMNGMALSGLRPFGSTFLVFSDYLRPAIRMSALMNLPVLYIFTHDSITVGEDGKTHQPIEQLASLELIPNLYIYRPFDVNELIASYKDILKNNRPSILVLPRDNKEVSELTKANKIEKGAYILKKEETENFVTLIANGEELGLVIKLSENLASLGIDTRIVSVTCYQNMIDNMEDGLDSLVPQDKLSIAITFGVSDYYYRFTGNVIGLNSFGESANKDDLLEHFGYDIASLEEKVMEMVRDYENK